MRARLSLRGRETERERDGERERERERERVCVYIRKQYKRKCIMNIICTTRDMIFILLMKSWI